MFLRSSSLLGRLIAPFPIGVPTARFFSTTFAAYSKKSILKLKSREKKEVNQLRQRYITEQNNTVDPVLGISNNPFLLRLDAEVQEPNVLGRFYEQNEVDKLLYGAKEASIKNKHAADLINETSETQREAVSRILSMRNRSDEDILKLKVKLAKEEFQRFDGDTGSSEVQAAVATIRIHHLYKHCQENKKDFKNTRLLRMLVQKRQRILRYLKRDDAERYYYTINKLGLTDHIVHAEFNMDRRYMQKFKMYGDRILVKESKTVQEEERKQKRKEKKILKTKSLKELRAMKKAIDRAAV